jgi:CheY-like chemotaxis protein
MTILIVEDDEMLRQSLVALFRRRGFTVTEAASGNQAIRIFNADSSIRLVIADYYMPDGDGGQLLRHIRSVDPERPPFILLTGQTDPSVVLPRVGLSELLFKPISPRDLINIVLRYATPDLTDADRPRP